MRVRHAYVKLLGFKILISIFFRFFKKKSGSVWYEDCGGGLNPQVSYRFLTADILRLVLSRGSFFFDGVEGRFCKRGKKNH